MRNCHGAAALSAPPLTLEAAKSLDAADPLRAFASQFAHPVDDRGEPLLYFCGHSLGLQPVAARQRVIEELDDWARRASLGHESGLRPWIEYHEHLTSGLQHLTGATDREVIAMNSLTVNLHLMLATFYRPAGRRTKIVIESGAFSSDRHAVVSQLLWHGLDPDEHLIDLAPQAGDDLIAAEAIETLLAERGAEIALVLWPAVQFRTGQAFDVPRLATAARRAGCIAGFDLAHSIGNLPHELHESDVDFAVWCSYKYLNAGPGAVGGCFVHERHLTSPALPRLAGWWGHDRSTRFQMNPGFLPQDGAAGWQVSNPPVLSTAPLIASLEIFQSAGIGALRAKSIALTALLAALVRSHSDLQIVTPDDPASRGCQLSLRVPGADARGRRVFEALLGQGAVVDWREPDIIRAAPAPLYTSHEDVFRLGTLLARTAAGIP